MRGTRARLSGASSCASPALSKTRRSRAPPRVELPDLALARGAAVGAVEVDAPAAGRPGALLAAEHRCARRLRLGARARRGVVGRRLGHRDVDPVDRERAQEREGDARVGRAVEDAQGLQLPRRLGQVAGAERLRVGHVAVQARVAAVLGLVQSAVVPGDRLVDEAPRRADGERLHRVAGARVHLEDVAVGPAGDGEALLARDPRAPGRRAAGAVRRRPAEHGALVAHAQPGAHDELRDAARDAGVRVVAQRSGHHDRDLQRVGRRPRRAAVLVVAQQHGRAPAAAEGGHPVEGRRRGAAVGHRLPRPRDHAVTEAARQGQVAAVDQRPVAAACGPAHPTRCARRRRRVGRP